MTRTAFVFEMSMEEGYINESTLIFKRNGVVFSVKSDKANTMDEFIELVEQRYKQACLKKQLVERARKRAIQREIIQLDETTEMEFKSEEAKKSWLIDAESPYGNVVLEYARRWAKYMQKLVAEGKSINEIARQTALVCDVRGIDACMYTFAIEFLLRFWKYGNELWNWYFSANGLKEKEFFYLHC